VAGARVRESPGAGVVHGGHGCDRRAAAAALATGGRIGHPEEGGELGTRVRRRDRDVGQGRAVEPGGARRARFPLGEITDGLGQVGAGAPAEGDDAVHAVAASLLYGGLHRGSRHMGLDAREGRDQLAAEGGRDATPVARGQPALRGHEQDAADADVPEQRSQVAHHSRSEADVLGVARVREPHGREVNRTGSSRSFPGARRGGCTTPVRRRGRRTPRGSRGRTTSR